MQEIEKKIFKNFVKMRAGLRMSKKSSKFAADLIKMS